MFDIRAGYIVLISGAITAMLRFLPFLVFEKKQPKFILYLGLVLPYAVMTMLVVYCLKDVNIFSGSHGLPEALSCLAVMILHIWRRNTLL
ncbi:MAG: AzlD domain-containing protein, partial [Synergistaceae bacterium]|nr:AzlD domain-containing protein [Synergistaceae bacterium]